MDEDLGVGQCLEIEINAFGDIFCCFGSQEIR